MVFGLGLGSFIGAGIRSIMIGCIAARITAIRIAMHRLRDIVQGQDLLRLGVLAIPLRLGVWTIRHLRVRAMELGILRHKRRCLPLTPGIHRHLRLNSQMS